MPALELGSLLSRVVYIPYLPGNMYIRYVIEMHDDYLTTRSSREHNLLEKLQIWE